MFGIRRYRLFLLVAALVAATLYHLSRPSSWNITNVDRLSRSGSKPDAQKPHFDDPVVQRPPPPVPPPPPKDEIRPAEPPVQSTKLPQKIASSSSASSSLSSSSSSSSSLSFSSLSSSSSSTLKATATSATTATRKPTTPIITGEELLGEVIDSDDEFAVEGSGRWEVDGTRKDGRKPKWQKPKAHFPLAEEDIISLPTGTARKLPKIQANFPGESSAAKKDRISKLTTIKESFKHAWNGYKQYGLPHDEVKPVTKSFADPFMGWGATLVDTLDTLWLMGLEQEFEEALIEVEKIDFHSSLRKDLPLFETVIRYLGGLIAAYDVSWGQYPILLAKAEELAELIMGAFDTPNRMPITFYNWAPSYASQPHRASAHSVMAEIGSLSMELTRLAQLTENHEYYDAIARITNALEEMQPDTLIPGLWPIKIDASGCKKAEIDMEEYYDDDEDFTPKPVLMDATNVNINRDKPAVVPAKIDSKTPAERPKSFVKRAYQKPRTRPVPYKGPLKEVEQEILAVECIAQGLAPEANAKIQTFGIGGQADSTYEYFPKMHQLLGGRTEQYEKMYFSSAKAIREELLFRPMIEERDREILFAAKQNLSPKAKTAEKRKAVVYEVTHLSCFVGGMFGLGAKIFGIESDLELAKQLTDGCVWAYESMPTGVMAEVAAVVPCPDLKVCAWDEKKWHQALDPKLEERLGAVDAWNKHQKEIYEKSRNQALKEAAIVKDEIDGPQPTKEATKGQSEPVKRQIADEEPSSTSPKLVVEERASPANPVSSPINFVPKVALSHEKYVKARIQEERLPPSYTKVSPRYYSLRPEAIESVFYMYRLTGDDTWRQKGWKMFEAVQSATQTEVANAGMKDVTSNLGELEDSMESFWLAETLKYFYLLFSEPELMSLDNWVANTEAHFFRVPE